MATFISVQAFRYTVSSPGLKSMAVQPNVHYNPLPTEDRRDDDDLQYKHTPQALERVPWRSIALALFLLFLGAVLLLLALFVITDHMSQGFGLLVAGILAFLPGLYETRVAYYSWRGAPGYRFSSIPDY